MQRALWLPLALLLSLLALLPAAVGAAPADRAAPALSWLRTQQQADGGFVGLNGKTDPSTTADVAVAFGAAGVAPSSVSAGGASITDYLQAAAASYGATTGGAAKLALAAAAAGMNPRQFGGVDAVGAIDGKYDEATGLYDPQLYVDALAILALKAAGQDVPPAAISGLTGKQTPDGSWAFDGKAAAGAGDSNTTAIVIQALAATGHAGDPAVKRGLAYLGKAQTTDGGFVYQPGAESPPVADANSTALAIQALLAAGLPRDSSTVTRALAALAGFQTADGAFFYRPDAKSANVLATVQAIPALVEQVLPVVASRSGQVAPATGSGALPLPWEVFGGVAALGFAALAAGARLRRRAA